MALKSYALTTLARFKTFADISSSSDDTLLTDMINQATEFIENYIGRRVKQTAYSNKEIDGTGAETLFLPNYPVSSTATFKLEERSTQENDDEWDTIDTDDYWVDYDAGIIHRIARQKWGVGKKRFRVTYTAGFDFDNSSTFLSDTAAGDLEYVIWKLVQTTYQRRRGGTGIVSESIGDYSVTYSKEATEDEEVKNILDKYASMTDPGTVGPVLY